MEVTQIILRDIMAKSVITVSENETATRCAKLMTEKDVGGLVVLRNRKPAGIVTERDLVKRVLAAGVNPDIAKVRDFMSAPLVTAKSDTEIQDAVELMKRKDIRRLVIMDGEVLSGIVTSRDVLMYLRNYVDSRLKDLIFATSWW